MIYRSIAAAAVAALALSACAPSDPEPEASPTTAVEPSPTPEAVATGAAGEPRGALPDVQDERDPYQVANAAAVTSQTLDTRLDVSPADGSRRAVQWFTTDYAQAVTQARPDSGGADWIALAEVDGYTEAESVDTSHEPRDYSEEIEAELIRVTFIRRLDADGELLSEQRIGLFVSLVRNNTDDPWRVNAITTR